MIKKTFMFLLAFIILNFNPTFGFGVSEFTNDAKIQTALDYLQNHGEYEVFNNMRKNQVKVKFDDLDMYSTGQAIYATNMYDAYDRRIIVINSRYQNAPVEQIACLIAHESFHTAKKATLDEETRATQKEAECWAKFKNPTKVYQQNKLTKRLDKLAGLYLASTVNNNEIHNKIASSSFYRQQFGL